MKRILKHLWLTQPAVLQNNVINIGCINLRTVLLSIQQKIIFKQNSPIICLFLPRENTALLLDFVSQG